MGAALQNQDSTSGGQVYYDSQKGQYYTTNQPQQSDNFLSQLFGQSPEFSAMMNGNRKYIGTNPLNNTYNPMQVDSSMAPYPTTESLFPTLNAQLAQNLQNINAGQQSSGAGRFVAPSLLSTNTSKGT